MGRRINWRVYQSVFSNDVFAMTTSRRTPSTSCAYHSGNVSLSPTVTRTPYGSTEFSRSAATLRVVRWCARDAELQLVNRGTIASSKAGDAFCHDRPVGSTMISRPSFRSRVPNAAASVSHTYARPIAAHTPHAEKLQRKK